MLGRRRQRGDTLIEVLFAVTVFSFVVVGALSIMNQGTAASQRSLEITLVRQQIDAQAETLRFVHDSYVSAFRPNISFNLTDGSTSPAEEWWRMSEGIDSSVRTATPFGSSAAQCPAAPANSFVMDPRNVRYVARSATSLVASVTFAEVAYNTNGTFNASRGLWIEPIRSVPNTSDPDQANIGFVDFHIRACWQAPGLSAPLTTGTIVRLYEPLD